MTRPTRLPVEWVPGTDRYRLVRQRPARTDPYRSNLERAYAHYLATLVQAGALQSWRYEGLRLILAPKTTYCPDFLTVSHDGRIELREVKGWMREDAAVKLKVAAALFPMFRFRLVTRECGQWVERWVER